jgi:hypothetical protein
VVAAIADGGGPAVTDQAITPLGLEGLERRELALKGKSETVAVYVMPGPA